MEAFIQDKDSKQISDVGYIEEDGKKTGYKFTYPEYESDGKKFAVTVEVRPYQNTENADADYNKKEVVDLKRIDLSKDGVYVQDDKIIEGTGGPERYGTEKFRHPVELCSSGR